MSGGAVVAICQFGGELVSSSDGSMSYVGGEAHAIDVDRNMLFNDFKADINTVFNTDVSAMSIKYFLPNNKRTLITVSCDKDLQRMIDFHENFITVDIYILNKVGNRVAGNILGNSGASTAAPVTTNRNAGQQKRTAARNDTGRMTRSRVRANLVAPEGPNVTVVASENVSQQRLDAAEVRENCVVPADHPEAAHVSTTNYPNHQYLPALGEDIITGVGQEFDNVKDFRDKLCEYAISKGFTYKFVKNETTRVTVKCTAGDCPWRMHASQTTRKKKIMIKKLIDIHTCGGGTANGGQRRVTKKWLVNIIKKKLRDNPECKPKEIAEDIYQDYGINVSYFQVWHAKTDAEKELFNMHVEACNQLPWFCERILQSNPGSIVTLATSADSRFRLFVSFHACLHGFGHGCRPLLLLDTIPLKKNNQLRLLAAAAVDGEDGIFPVAFAAVEAETYDSWFWFLEQLKYALTPSSTITFVSNRRNGLEEALPQVFEDSHHGFCLIDLLEDFRAELKKGSWTQNVEDAMVNDFECAAQACLVEEFNGHIENIRMASKDAADWVMATKPEHWSNAFFKGSRYNHFSSDITEFSNWISVRQESSVVLMIDAICTKVMETIHVRRESSNTWEGTLAPSVEQKLKKEEAKAHKLEVLCSSDTVFEVRGKSVEVVNIETCECTCRLWQITGLPCVHTFAVLNHLGRSVYDYCSRYFSVDCYRITYSESVNQIPDVERISSIVRGKIYHTPARQPKWPRKNRDRQKKADVRELHCSRCKEAGHNKATCEAVM